VFGTNALDAARFFFGTDEAKVELFPGEMTLTEFLEGGDEFDADMGKRQHGDRTIPEGSLGRSDSNSLAAILIKLGWERLPCKQRIPLYGPQIVYVPKDCS
jgi:putative DNA primase/helicase